MSTENGMYQALRKGPSTAAEVAKRSKVDPEEVEAELENWRNRLWVERDDSGKTPKFTLTDLAQRDLAARYPDEA